MIVIPTPIPITIHPLFWVVCLLIGFLNTGFAFLGLLSWVLVIFVSILIHELGHALTAKGFGQMARIDLVGFGGLTTHTGRNLSALKNFLIVLNGPIMGFLLFAVLVLLRPYVPAEGFLSYTVRIGILINLIWTVLNLLPILPLDGGQLLRIVLERFFGVGGIKATAMIGLIVAGSVGVLSIMYGQIILAVLFFFFAAQSFFTFRALKQMRSQDNNFEIIERLKMGQKKMMDGQEGDAEKTFEAIRGETKEGIVYLQATQMLAAIVKKKGDTQRAYDLLHSISKDLSIEGKAVLQELAYLHGKFDEALQLGKECYEQIPAAEIAFKNSCSCAQLQRAKESIGWFKSAMEKGLQDPVQVIDREDFNPIRESKEFQSFVQSLK